MEKKVDVIECGSEGGAKTKELEEEEEEVMGEKQKKYY